jgi:hypothetical protein
MSLLDGLLVSRLIQHFDDHSFGRSRIARRPQEWDAGTTGESALSDMMASYVRAHSSHS